MKDVSEEQLSDDHQGIVQLVQLGKAGKSVNFVPLSRVGLWVFFLSRLVDGITSGNGSIRG